MVILLGGSGGRGWQERRPLWPHRVRGRRKYDRQAGPRSHSTQKTSSELWISSEMTGSPWRTGARSATGPPPPFAGSLWLLCREQTECAVRHQRRQDFFSFVPFLCLFYNLCKDPFRVFKYFSAKKWMELVKHPIKVA